MKGLQIFLTLGLVGVLSACGMPDLTVLKSQYPLIIHLGKKQPPKIKFVKGRPEDWIPIERISKAALSAVIVSEDWAFYTHNGIDTNQIREAIEESYEEGKLTRGASTITQQVVKNVFLSPEKSLLRKAKEAFLAVRLEKVITKRKILEIYFNVAEWGDGIYGIGPAARYYFQKAPSELTAKEGAFLAMLLPSPIRYGQSFRSKRLTAFARRQVESILTKMVQAHYLNEEEKTAELARPLSFEKEAPIEGPGDTPSPEEESLTIPNGSGEDS